MTLEQRLETHIQTLTDLGPRHPTNTDAVTAALDYITETLEGFDYVVTRVEYGPAPHNVNLIAADRALDNHGPVLELGAHWDSVQGSPGADDNASGVAGLLEIARELADDAALRRVRFCFFGDEEESDQFPRGRGGSSAHVQQLDADGVEVEGAIVFEMIGYTDPRAGAQQVPASLADQLQEQLEKLPATFIAAVGNQASDRYVQGLVSAATSLDPALPVVPVVSANAAGDLARSDHASYWAAHRKGIMLTDTANFRNPHYHQPTDTLETLDLGFAAQVIRAGVQAVRMLVN